MNQTTRRNAYHINEQSGTAIFEVRDVHENVAIEFIADVDDVDVFAGITWYKKVHQTPSIVPSKGQAASPRYKPLAINMFTQMINVRYFWLK